MAHSLLPKLWGHEKGAADPFTNLQREIDRVFDQFHRQDAWPFPVSGPGNGKLVPRINVSETETEIEVTAELPGVEDKEIDVSLTDDLLTIRGEKKTESEKQEKDYRLVERSYGAFERAMRLPCEVEADKIDATFKNGILTVKLPKSQAAKGKTQRISVTSQ